MYLMPNALISNVLDIKHKYIRLVLIIVTNSIECLLCAKHNPSFFIRSLTWSLLYLHRWENWNIERTASLDRDYT